MPHDDESAEVEPVRGGGHETRWDCYGRIVEGAGELGPSSGRRYEGKHTKRNYVRHRVGKPHSVIVPEDARSVRSARSTRSLKEDAVIGIGKPVVIISSPSVSTAGKKRKRVGKNEEDERDSEEEPVIRPKSKATRTRAKPKEKKNNQTDNDDDAKSVRSVT